jgi:uncharacterized protein YndB with AHSA1/START domain
MTEQQTEASVVHADFTIEKNYRASVDTVFAAWADAAQKAAWFAPAPSTHSLDFAVGGSEHVSNAGPGGVEITFDSRYSDIVPGKRLVYTSELAVGGAIATVSMTTVEFETGLDASGTRLVLTEQDVYLDGQEKPEWREQGTSDWLDKLGAAVDGPAGVEGRA